MEIYSHLPWKATAMMSQEPFILTGTSGDKRNHAELCDWLSDFP